MHLNCKHMLSFKWLLLLLRLKGTYCKETYKVGANPWQALLFFFANFYLVLWKPEKLCLFTVSHETDWNSDESRQSILALWQLVWRRFYLHEIRAVRSSIMKTCWELVDSKSLSNIAAQLTSSVKNRRAWSCVAYMLLICIASSVTGTVQPRWRDQKPHGVYIYVDIFCMLSLSSGFPYSGCFTKKGITHSMRDLSKAMHVHCVEHMSEPEPFWLPQEASSILGNLLETNVTPLWFKKHRRKDKWLSR